MSRRGDLGRLLELVGLSAIAVAQPVLGALGQSPERFVVVGARRWEIVALAVIVVVVPPLVVWAIGLLLGLASERARDLWQALGVGFFFSIFVVLALREWVGLTFVSALVVGLLAWSFAVIVYLEVPLVRVWPRYLAVAAPVVLVLFLVLSPVGAIVLPSQAAAIEHVESNGAPVFVLAFDEFPLMGLLDSTGSIDPELFPNLAALAGDSTWYRNTTTVHGLTLQAVPAILTGSNPDGEITAPTVTKYPHSLFTLLAGSYDLEVYEHFQMCPSQTCGGAAGDSGVGSPLEQLVGDAGSILRNRLFPEAEPLLSVHGWDPATGQGDVDRFEQMLASIGPDDADHALFFEHVMLPHARFQYLPDGQRYNDPDPSFGLDENTNYLALSWTNEETAALARMRHRLQTMWVDTMVGRLVDRLREVGIYDDAVIVVTADHGVSLTAGEAHRAVSDSNAPEILWVPLIVKGPHQRAGATSDANVETIDVLPTIADLLDVELPWTVDGIVAGTRTGTTKHFFGKWNGRDPADGRTFEPEPGFSTVTAGPHEAPTDASPEYRAYSTGVEAELLGGRVSADADDSGIGYAFDDPDAWRDVDVDGEFVPVYVSGKLQVDGDAITVAVVVNGRVAGVGRTFAYGGDDHRFAIVVPPSTLRDGENSIILYEVDTNGSATVFHTIGAA